MTSAAPVLPQKARWDVPTGAGSVEFYFPTSEKFLWQSSGTFVGLMAFHSSPWVIAYPQSIEKMTFPSELCGD